MGVRLRKKLESIVKVIGLWIIFSSVALAPIIAYADKANYVISEEDSLYHVEHLKNHLQTDNCVCTGIYVKVKSEASGNSKIIGHLERADEFRLLEVQGNYARVDVINSAVSSRDSWVGLEGWVNADYVQCPCDEEAYYGRLEPSEENKEIEGSISENQSEIVAVYEDDLKLEKEEYTDYGVVIVLFLALVWWGKTIRKRRFIARVEKSSRRLCALREMNAKCCWNDNVESEYCQSIYLKSKSQFDQLDFDKYMKNHIYAHIVQYDDLTCLIEHNRKQMRWYNGELNKLPDYATRKEARRNKVPYSAYRKYEERICAKNTQCPVISPCFVCKAYYVSPKGRNEYIKEKKYTYEQYVELYNCAVQQHKRRPAEGTAAFERSKMTSSLRYDIIKRDMGRCVICGRSAKDGVKLHVDHIVPVSKGGKTEPNNLRTLCSECNMGKRDKYDEYGYN